MADEEPSSSTEFHVRDMRVQDYENVRMLCRAELQLEGDATSLLSVLERRPFHAAVASIDNRVVGFVFGHVDANREPTGIGYIDLIVVARLARRKGIGTALLRFVETLFKTSGCVGSHVKGRGPHYLWPGVDLRYTPAICFLNDMGYVRYETIVNMDVDLTPDNIDTTSILTSLTTAGVLIRRACLEDADQMSRDLDGLWKPTWIEAITSALSLQERGGTYIAQQKGTILGFCSYGVNQPDEVGPMGTHPTYRGIGIGSALIKSCLEDQHNLGLTRAQIQWAGPISFFSDTLSAKIGRVFWTYRKTFSEQA